MALSWIIRDHRQDVVRECHWQPPKQHSAEALAIARATFCRIPGNSRGVILEHHWQQPKRNSGVLLATAKAQFGSGIVSRPGRHQEA